PWLQMTNMISYQGLVRTFPKYCAKFTRKEAILTPPTYFNKTSIPSDCWQILFFSPDHFNNDFY
ncbi:hypothetical protein L0N13_08285, partial [Escherichia coli]|nr:hypothetical protein [Escherichia coli]